MTIDALGGRAGAAVATEPLAIGDEDRLIVACASCARPLASGTRRCPACRALYVRDVPLGRASAFVATGLVGGLAAGIVAGAALGAVALGRQAADPAVDRPAPIVSAVPDPARPAATAAALPGASIPAMARVALAQSATMNDRLLAGHETLRTAAAAADVDTLAVATVLRAMASDASFASGLAERVGRWDEAATLATGLSELYTDVRATAREGLAASLSNDTAYRNAAARMLDVLAGVAPIDLQTRKLAAVAEVEIPPVQLPPGR